MATKLSMRAQEGSTFVIRADFYAKSSDGTPASPVTPNDDLTWTLKDGSGAVVNNRKEVSLPTGEYVLIALFGDDLALPGNSPEKRHLLIEGTFDSELGNGLPLREEVVFQIDNLVGVDPT